MSFSKEDKKKVFDFFQNLLLKFDKPVYYEQLRGYVSSAEPVIKKYVLKECKGEKLLRYFQNHKNYFFVDFRNEVMLLNKNKCTKDTLSEAAKLDAEQHATATDNISYEELTSSEYFNCSRSTSVSSRYGSEASSVDDVVVDAYTNKKSECEEETIKYFSDYLALNKKLNLHDIEIKCLPKNIRQYLTKYFKKDIALFFKKNPETFYIDDKNSMSLMSSRKLQHGTTVVAGEEITLRDDAIISLHNFIHCAEFFFGILKKKFLPLSYLSGYLSRASPDVSEYLKSNYATFKDFLLEADKLFVFNDYEEVAATKDGPKLLRSANKLLHADSPISPESLKREIYSYLKSETSKKRNSLSGKDQENTCSDAKQLEISNIENLNEDKHLVNSKRVKPEKLDISDEENINIESIDCNKLKSDDLHSAKKKKLKADEFNISNDENINVSSVGCNKTLEDKFKNEPIITNIHEENVIEVADEELAPDVGGTFENFMDSDEPDGIKSVTQRNFIECVFTIQLLCLEMIEKQLILCYKYEYDAVKYFVEVLEKLPLEMNDVTSLKGSLGQASKEVNLFMKTLYKGDKISLFFEKHDEFDLTPMNFDNSKILRLSPSYKCDLEDRRKAHKLYVAGTKVYDVYKLYNLQLHDMFIDVLDCLTKICRFLQNKPRIKLTRLNGVFSKLSPTQQNFINSLDGGEIHKKLERFLCYFSFFQVMEEEEFIELNREHLDITLFLNSMIKFTEKLNMLNTYDESKLVFFDYLLDYLKEYEKDYSVMSFDEMKVHVIESVQNFISCVPDLQYSYLPDVVGYEVLHNLVLGKKDSQFLIQLLEESNLFLLHDGEISHRQENDKEMDFISDSNSSDKISSEDSKSEKSESSVTEYVNKLHEKKEHISDDGQKDALSNIPPLFCKNDEHVKVDEVCHEDLEISVPKRHSFIEDDVCVDSEESKTFNKNLMNEDSAVVSLNKNKFSDQQQDEQNDLNYENNFRNKLISSASAQNDARSNSESNIQGNCKQSDVPSSEDTVLNLKTDSNISCATIFNKQEVEIESESLSVDDKAAKLVKSSINESNKKTVSENTDSTIKQKNSSSIDEINVSVSTEKFSKPSLLSNSTVVNYSKVWESLCKSSVSLEKEKNASEISDKQITSNTDDVNLNCIENISSTKQLQNSSFCDHKSDSDHKNYIRNASSNSSTSDNIKSHPILNFESNRNNNKTHLNKASKTGNKSVTSPTFSGSPVSKSDSNESDSEGDKPRHNFDSTFLQPLQAKIIILTLDSCIAETVVNSQKKCIFCLKSCFQCDLHSDCSDCFNSLFVGDEILCYIPPTEDLNCGNMCFAFMFHKDLGKNDSATSHRGNIHNEYLQRNSGKDKFCSSVVEESQVQYSVISQSAQVPSSVPSQSTQVLSSVASQITQTNESSFKKCHKTEKECQVKCTSVSQITQTANITSEANCQTVLAGEVKSCVSVSEKACLTRFPTFSQNTQTICETVDHGSQTNLSGNIIPKCDTSSCECQTVLTGQVQKCGSVIDKCCQTLFSRQVVKTTQTETENDAEMRVRKGAGLKSGSFDNIPCDANTGARSKHSFLVAQKEFCDTSCQTRSTGAIYLMAIYHDEE